MPPKQDGKRKPANIIVGRAGKSGQTFSNTSLVPFLRAYTRMNSRDAGGGDRQFNEELELSQRIVAELNRFRDAPPEFIHELVSSIANPIPGQRPLYPTLRTQDLSDQVVYQNRIIVSVLLMMHATNDRDGDGGVTRGGLWLPPRQQAREAQDAAAQRGHAVQYPTWSQEEGEASTPARSANWTASGQPPRLDHQAGSLRSRGFDSPVGNLPPFSPHYRPTPNAMYGQPSPALGPPSAGLGGYHWSSRGPQQYPSNTSLNSEYGAPSPSAGLPRPYIQDTMRTILPHVHRGQSQGNEQVPSANANTTTRELADHSFWQASYSHMNQPRRPSAYLPPPPGLEGVNHVSAFGSVTTTPPRPAQPPIGSDRPGHDNRRHRGSRGDSGS